MAKLISPVVFWWGQGSSTAARDSVGDDWDVQAKVGWI